MFRNFKLLQAPLMNTFLSIFLDARQGKCYIVLNDAKMCVETLPIKLSKMDCCCGKNMGKAWGDECALCPASGSGQ
jgi:hypothetical protein